MKVTVTEDGPCLAARGFPSPISAQKTAATWSWRHDQQRPEATARTNSNPRSPSCQPGPDLRMTQFANARPPELGASSGTGGGSREHALWHLETAVHPSTPRSTLF